MSSAAAGAAVYNTQNGQKLCVIFRDNPTVHVQPVRDAFGSEMQFQLVERNVESGESAREVLQYFDNLAKDTVYEGFSCLSVVMTGCYNARNGWGINVSGLDIDFERLLNPFTKSRVWMGKPKLFFVQYESEELESTMCCDIRLIDEAETTVGSWTEFADTALVLGYGGEDYTRMLCALMMEHGSKLEFHQLMTLMNSQIMLSQNPDEEAPMAAGFVSRLRKMLFLASL